MTLMINSKDNYDCTKFEVIELIKKLIEEDDELFLSTNTINNLAIHIAMSIIRIKSNNYIPLSTSQIESYKDEGSYKYALKICNTIGERFDIEFPESELSLVSMYVSKNKALDVELNSGFDLLDDDIYEIIRETMHNIKNKYDIDFRNDDKTFVAIGLHLTPALERLKNDQQLENPLTAKIKERHNQEFLYAKEINVITKEKYQKEFTDDELAFIALHFVVAINLNKDMFK